MGKILVLENAKVLSEVEVENEIVSFEDIREALDGGWIERVTYNKELYENNIDVFVDEEGKLKALECLAVVFDFKTDRIIETLAGKLIFVGRRGSESIPLNVNQISVINKVLSKVVKDAKGNMCRIIPYK